MGKFLVTGDIHLTAHPRDEYRWDLFPWLRRKAEKHGVKDLIILGDLTDKKDHHSAHLVNRIVSALRSLEMRVVVMMGNHDYDQDASCPFFKFLPEFVIAPTAATLAEVPVFLIPHVRKTEGHEWPEAPEGTRVVFMHQTFRGAVAENGQALGGMDPGVLRIPKGAIVVSGDIHVPQNLGKILYCGAPHPIRFGDSFDPRVLLWDGDGMVSLRRRTIRKAILGCEGVKSAEDVTGLLAQEELNAWDQIKVRVTMPRSAFGEWANIREAVMSWAKKAEVLLQGCTLEEQPSASKRKDPSGKQQVKGATATHQEVFAAFCKDKAISPEYAKVGEAFLHE